MLCYANCDYFLYSTLLLEEFYPQSMAGGTATSEADNLVQIMKEMNEQNSNHSAIFTPICGAKHFLTHKSDLNDILKY